MREQVMATDGSRKEAGDRESHQEEPRALKKVSVRMCAFYLLLDDRK